MKNKLICIIICTILIATIIPITLSTSDCELKNIIDKNKDLIGYFPTISYNPPSVEYILRHKNSYTKTNLENGWQWLPSYPNYSPKGIPDFSQLQNYWGTICDGGNGIAESVANGDDIQVAPYGSSVNPDPIAPIVAPGYNCNMDSTKGGDDLYYWTFCAPTSYANCLWWYDSRYSNSNGIPGDGLDNFPLVEDYGVGDDHKLTNVPLLICKLANLMNITTKGYGYYDDLIYGLDKWFIDTEFNDNFDRVFYEKPTFNYIVDEFEQNNFIILILGFYDKIGENYIFKGEHATSISGINSDNLQIAISDPCFDIENPSGFNHNDAQNVSYDIYDVVIGSPAPEIECECWLPDYAEGIHNYTVVRVVDVIIPHKSDLNCVGSLSWVDVNPGSIVTNNFQVENIGADGSLLNWKIDSYPIWGLWTFTPKNGTCLENDSSLQINVSVIAPTEKQKETYTGTIKIINSDNASDFCEVDVSLITPRNNKGNFIKLILERFSFLEMLFNNLRGSFLG